MTNISLKLKDEIFSETERLLPQLNKNRNAYLNEAIAFYNRYQKRMLIANQLRLESALIADTSLEVLAEMEALEDILLTEN
ncbi:MAG: hypothetical protein Q7T20_18045 [Saprospiraceae bacterium]|nr:hypothetical protein [Saprospiraceae bacterium]